MQIASRQLLWNDSLGGSGKTVLVVRADALCMTAKICSGSLAPGSTEVTVDWGDGTVEQFPNLNGRMHTYSRTKDYRIKISDDLSSFGYTAGNPGGDHYRDMLIELVSLGTKVTTITVYGFNNCHNMRGVMNLPNVTSIGGYAFGTTLGITDFILPSMTRLVQTSFYSGPSPTQIHADNVRQIDSRFWDYYGWRLYDLYLRSSTCAQIKAMNGFPFNADRVANTVRFHGSDGIVLGNGTIIH